MPYIEKSLNLSVTSVLKFPLLLESTEEQSSLDRTVEFIFESIELEASAPAKSRVFFDIYDWQIIVKIRSSQLISNSDNATAEFQWNIEAEVSHPSEIEMSTNEVIQEINWVVTPNTVWDDEIEVTSLTFEIN